MACREMSAEEVAAEMAGMSIYDRWWLNSGWPSAETRAAMKPLAAARAEMEALHRLRDAYEAERSALLAALLPFAKFKLSAALERARDDDPFYVTDFGERTEITVGDFRRARKATTP